MLTGPYRVCEAHRTVGCRGLTCMSALPLKFKHQLAAVVTAEQLRERVGERVDVAAYGVFDAAQPPVVKPARHFRDCSSSRHTAAVSLPPATSRSGGINLRTICSGLCGLLVAMILSSFPALNMDRKTLVRLDQPAGSGQTVYVDPGSVTAASSKNQTPLGNSSARSAATSTARRVLPTPPAPVSVTRRCARSAASISAISDSRPTKLVAAGRRFPRLGSRVRKGGKSSGRPGRRRRCPNGHPLGPNQVRVGHVACLGHGGGGHTSRRCRPVHS
jgi:hypothetical protein